ncbi:hypothetical protein [Nonomuraea sp. NPDC001831]|uniref:hypothetical protein n=1 Tax=Nonomuraea sp. NPDC001831 TaxID=3364340 RepID=UPI00368D86CC
MNLADLHRRYGHDWHIVPLPYGGAAWRRQPPTREQFRQGLLHSLVGVDPDHLGGQLARQAELQTQRPGPLPSSTLPRPAGVTDDRL